MEDCQNNDCIDHQLMLNYVGGTLRDDFICFNDEDIHAIGVHLMLCEDCQTRADILREQLKAQVPWLRE